MLVSACRKVYLNHKINIQVRSSGYVMCCYLAHTSSNIYTIVLVTEVTEVTEVPVLFESDIKPCSSFPPLSWSLGNQANLWRTCTTSAPWRSGHRTGSGSRQQQGGPRARAAELGGRGPG